MWLWNLVSHSDDESNCPGKYVGLCKKQELRRKDKTVSLLLQRGLGIPRQEATSVPTKMKKNQSDYKTRISFPNFALKRIRDQITTLHEDERYTSKQ
jgi:hypothetical protein